MRKILLTIGIIIGVAIIVAAYFFVSNLISPEKKEEKESISQPAPETAMDKKINQVSDKELNSYWFDSDGRIYLAETNGVITNISPQMLENLHKLAPSSDGTKVLAEFGYHHEQSFSIFDIARGSWTPLPPGTIAAAWHPEDSSQLVYLQNSSLKSLDLKNKKTTSIVRLNLVDVLLYWPEKDRLLISDLPSALVENKVWEFSLKNKNLKEIARGNGLIIKENNGLRFQFAGTASRLSVSLLNSGVSLDFSSLFNSQKTTTLPEKCAVSGFKIYCAVPVNIPDNILLPDDYYKRKFISADAFYAINVNPQTDSAVAELIHYNPANQIDAANVSVNGSKLYFINRIDNKLYSLEL